MISRIPTSLDKSLAEDDDTALEDFIADEQTPSPEQVATQRAGSEALEDALDTLDERERAVISLRFGLVDGESRTLEQVGKEFDLTRERIRQIQGQRVPQAAPPGAAQRAARVPVGLAIDDAACRRGASGPAAATL